jgi:hypothetical protein
VMEWLVVVAVYRCADTGLCTIGRYPHTVPQRLFYPHADNWDMVVLWVWAVRSAYSRSRL